MDVHAYIRMYVSTALKGAYATGITDDGTHCSSEIPVTAEHVSCGIDGSNLSEVNHCYFTSRVPDHHETSTTKGKKGKLVFLLSTYVLLSLSLSLSLSHTHTHTHTHSLSHSPSLPSTMDPFSDTIAPVERTTCLQRPLYTDHGPRQ